MAIARTSTVPVQEADLAFLIRRELLTNAVSDTPGAENFFWQMTALHRDFSQAGLIMTITALHRDSGEVYDRSVYMLTDSLPVDSLLKLVDEHVLASVRQIVADVHIEGQLCANKFCAECYA